jgi:putative endonuclease
MKKNTAYTKGIASEIYVHIYLSLKGYKLLKKRFKTTFGEIDLLMCKHKTLVAVEVKHRKLIHNALASITLKQKERIKNTLLIAQQQYPEFLYLRCDTVLISPWKWPIHIKNAF